MLTEQNFTMFAIRHYDNPHCYSEDEFNEDIFRFVALKRLLIKYVNTGELKERLILNHLTILYNVFGESTTRMLLYKLPEKTYPSLKTFLVFINRLHQSPTKHEIPLLNIPIDINITKRLREI